jgi:trimeric autotransporter adhesin
MPHILCVDRAHKAGVFASFTFAAVVLLLSNIPAFAGCNSGNLPSGSLLSSNPCQAHADGTASVAIGSGAYTGDGSIAIGNDAVAAGPLSTAVGTGSAGLLDVLGVTTVGAWSGGLVVPGRFSTAFGAGKGPDPAPRAAGHYSIAVGGGDGTDFTPSVGTPIKLNGARANGFISMAFGVGAQATGGGSSAFGLGSQAIANDSAAYGEFSKAGGPSSIAMGLLSSTLGSSSLAFGPKTVASSVNAVAIGSGAQAKANNAVALGSVSVADVANTVSVGSATYHRRIVNLAPGISGFDAVTLAQAKQLAKAAARDAVEAKAETEVLDLADLRRELAELRAEIAELKSRKVAVQVD